MKEKHRPGRMRAKDDEQWSLLSMERRTELRAPEVTGHTDPRRPLPGITKDGFSFRPSFISAHDVIAGKKMDSCKQRSAVNA